MPSVPRLAPPRKMNPYTVSVPRPAAPRDEQVVTATPAHSLAHPGWGVVVIVSPEATAAARVVIVRESRSLAHPGCASAPRTKVRQQSYPSPNPPAVPPLSVAPSDHRRAEWCGNATTRSDATEREVSTDVPHNVVV